MPKYTYPVKFDNKALGFIRLPQTLLLAKVIFQLPDQLRIYNLTNIRT